MTEADVARDDRACLDEASYTKTTTIPHQWAGSERAKSILTRIEAAWRPGATGQPAADTTAGAEAPVAPTAALDQIPGLRRFRQHEDPVAGRAGGRVGDRRSPFSLGLPST